MAKHRRILSGLVLALAVCLSSPAWAEDLQITTFAGPVQAGAGDQDGQSDSARFNGPQGVAVDGSGNVYVGDTCNNTIRKITPRGVIMRIVYTAPTVSSVTATVNGVATDTVWVNTQVTFTADANDPNMDPLTIAWDIGGLTAPTGNPVNYTFTTPGGYRVAATANDGATTSAQTSMNLTVLSPSSGGSGVTNISQDGGTVTENPLNGVKMSVTNSNGGVVELFVDVQAMNQEEFSVETDFALPSRAAYPTAHGVKPIVKVDTHGLAVATANVSRVSTGLVEGKARKMLAASVLETDDGQLLKLPKAPSSVITVKSFKGKFTFSGTNDAKPDSVSLAGTIKLPAGIDVRTEQELWVGAGNIVDRVILDVKGKAKDKSKGDNGRIKKVKVKWPKLAKDVTLTREGDPATVTVTFSLADMDKLGFDTEGVTSTLRADEGGLRSVRRQIQSAIVLAGVAYETLVNSDFKLSKKQDRGQLKLPSRSGQ